MANHHDIEQRLAQLENQLKNAQDDIQHLLTLTSSDNSPDLRVKQLTDELNATQILFARVLSQLVDSGAIQASDLKQIFKSLLQDYPYPTDNTAPKHTNTAVHYLFKTIFTQIPDYQPPAFVRNK